MQREELFWSLALASYPLRELNTSLEVINAASASQIKFKNKFCILTVEHATKKGNWAIHCNYDYKERKSKLHLLGNLTFMKLANINSNTIIDVDFAFTFFDQPIDAFYEVLDIKGSVSNQKKRSILEVDEIKQPDSERLYGFSGYTKLEKTEKILFSDPIVEMDMQYVNTDNNFHKFKLNHKHPGHEYYKGCSGSPILDENLNIVSLVVKGCEKDDLIYGLNLQKFMPAVEAELKS